MAEDAPQRPSPTEGIPLRIQEMGTNAEQNINGVTIILQDDDAPHGQPRDEVAWDEGGGTKHEVVRYPGRKKPSYFGLYWEPERRVFHGALRSHLDGQDFRKNAATLQQQNDRRGRATAIKTEIEQLAKRFTPVRVTFGDESFDGMLVKAVFPREGPEDYKYELTFEVEQESGDEVSDEAQAENPRTTQLLTDVIARVRSDFAATKARIAAMRVQADLQNALAEATNAADIALNDLANTARSFEATTVGLGKQLQTLAQRVQARAASAQASLGTLEDTLGTVSADTGTANNAAPVAGTPPLSAADLVTNASAQADSIVSLQGSQQDLRRVRAEAQARVQKNAKVYKVQKGDTLESIAASQLGSRARAPDLGLTDRDLTTGRVIPLPEA